MWLSLFSPPEAPTYTHDIELDGPGNPLMAPLPNGAHRATIGGSEMVQEADYTPWGHCHRVIVREVAHAKRVEDGREERVPE